MTTGFIAGRYIGENIRLLFGLVPKGDEQLGESPVRDRVTPRASATRACGFSAPRPVPVFSLNAVPSPHLVGFSRDAPQSVAGGRQGEDSRVRMESPVLIPYAIIPICIWTSLSGGFDWTPVQGSINS
jgi:hypothetical protein